MSSSGENCKQQRQKRRRSGCGQTGHVVESEGDRTHRAYKAIAVREVG